MTTVADLIEANELVEPCGLRITLALPASSDLARQNSDISASDLANHYISARIPHAIANVVIAHARHRKALVVLPDDETAEMVAAELRRRDLRAVALPSDDEDPDHEEIIARARGDEFDVLATVAGESIDLDVPTMDCLVMARPTLSQSLYEHCAKQVLTPTAGKESPLIIDIVGPGEPPATKTITCLHDRFPEGATLHDGESLLNALTRIESDSLRYAIDDEGKLSVRASKQFLDSPYPWVYEGDRLFMLGSSELVLVANHSQKGSDWRVYAMSNSTGHVASVSGGMPLYDARRMAEQEYERRGLEPYKYSGELTGPQRIYLQALGCPSDRIDRVQSMAEASNLIALYKAAKSLRKYIIRSAPRRRKEPRRAA